MLVLLVVVVSGVVFVVVVVVMVVVDVDKVSYAGDAADKKEVGVELHSGKNRIVRRLFESLGYNIVKLDRVSFAGLTKKNLKKGQWRFLTPKEVSFLSMLK